MSLPIDVVNELRQPGPPRFRWQQTVASPGTGAERVVEFEGTVPPSLEGALVGLINLCKQQAQEIKGLQKQIERTAAGTGKKGKG